MQKNDTQSRSDVPFQKIDEAVKTTGLSAYYLRQGCRSGSIPCVRSGRTIYINVPLFMTKLRCQTETAVHGGGCDGKTEISY